MPAIGSNGVEWRGISGSRLQVGDFRGLVSGAFGDLFEGFLEGEEEQSAAFLLRARAGGMVGWWWCGYETLRRSFNGALQGSALHCKTSWLSNTLGIFAKSRPPQVLFARASGFLLRRASVSSSILHCLSKNKLLEWRGDRTINYKSLTVGCD